MFRLLFVIAIVAITDLVAADVSGQWTGKMELGNGNSAVDMFLTLRQYGDNVLGTLGYEAATKKGRLVARIEKTELHGGQLTFDIHTDASQTISFRLMVGDGGLTGEAISGSQVSKVIFPKSQFHPIVTEVSGNAFILYKVDPEYTDEARSAKFEGTIVLSVAIDEGGYPTNIKVVRGLGLGLDEKAVECLQKWIFFPAMKDGTPMQSTAMLELNFRLARFDGSGHRLP
jgi:TonB family protein